MADDLLGNQLQSVERREHDWLFSFSTGLRLQAAGPWRVVSDQRVAFGDGDDRQQFGLPAPIDGALKTEELLLGRTIQKVAIRYDTGDLTIAFDGEVSLEILNLSSGYEGLGDVCADWPRASGNRDGWRSARDLGNEASLKANDGR